MAKPPSRVAKGSIYKIPYLKPGLNNYPMHFGPGSVPSQIGYYIRRDKDWRERYEWKDNVVFTASLKFIGSQGQNRVMLRDNASEATYSMTMGNLIKLLKKGTTVFGDTFGRWKFSKNGDSYSLVPVF